MPDFLLMLWVDLLVVNRIHPESNKFGTGVENKAADDSKHTCTCNESPENKTIFFQKWFSTGCLNAHLAKSLSLTFVFLFGLIKMIILFCFGLNRQRSCSCKGYLLKGVEMFMKVT